MSRPRTLDPLRAARVRAGLQDLLAESTQEAVSKKLGIAQQSVSALVSRTSSPSFTTAEAVALALGIPVMELLGGALPGEAPAEAAAIPPLAGSLADRVKQALAARGMSQAALERAGGFSVGYVNRICKGARGARVPFATIKTMATQLGCDPVWLAGEPVRMARNHPEAGRPRPVARRSGPPTASALAQLAADAAPAIARAARAAPDALAASAAVGALLLELLKQASPPRTVELGTPCRAPELVDQKPSQKDQSK